MRRLTMLMRGSCAGAIIALTAGCSFQASVDAMVDRERQAAIVADARQLCDNVAGMQPKFEAQLWREVERQMPALAAECPPDGADYALTTYQFNSNATVGAGNIRQEQAVIVAGPDTGSNAEGPWSEIALTYVSENAGPVRIVGWHIQKMPQKPASLSFVESWDASVLWVRLGIAILLAVLVGGTIWILRRRQVQGKTMTDA
jgi:hypothetical protein